jgi:hypothetical protein
MLHQRCTTALERLERGRLIVWGALLPTAVQHAAPLAGHGAHSRLVGLARGAGLRVIGVCPAGMAERCRSPWHEGGAEAGRTLEAPVAPGCLATAFRHRRDARIFWECLGSRSAVPWCANGPEATRGKARPGPGPGGKARAGGRGVGALRAGGVEGGQGLSGEAEWGHAGGPQPGLGGAHAVIRAQRARGLSGLEAGGEDVGRAPVVGTAAGRQGGAPREWPGCQGGPAAQEGAQAGGLLLVHPLQDGRAGVFARPGHALRPAAWVAHPALAVCNEGRPGAHR